ncbi:MAG: hypothetical protein AB1635_12740, partial [Acidobacteriota bacterium]
QAVPILAGGRMLGRGAGFQVGALHIRTDDKPEASAVATDFSVIRINRDILRRSRVGVIATRRAPGAGAGLADNYAYGADASINPMTELSISGYWAGTQTPGRAGDAVSYRGRFDWNSDRTGLQADHIYVGQNFNPEVGFMSRLSFRRTSGEARYSPRPPNIPGVRKLFFEAGVDYYEHATGYVESREVQGTFRLEFTTTDQITVEVSDAFERLVSPFTVAPGVTIPAGDYAFQQARVFLMLSQSRPLSGSVSVQAGAFYGGTIREVSWRGRVEFSSRLALEPTISFNHVDTPFGVGDTNLVGARVTYTLSPKMFVGTLIQYQSAADTVSTNVRFRWEYAPGSDLFVVYSDGRDTAGSRFPPTLLNRSVVVKATRLLRF